MVVKMPFIGNLLTVEYSRTLIMYTDHVNIAHYVLTKSIVITRIVISQLFETLLSTKMRGKIEIETKNRAV